MTDRDLVLVIREALLMIVDALERWASIAPRTAEIRKAHRAK